MTIHKFSAEGRFECGFDTFVTGKVWAFVPVFSQHSSKDIGLGIAVANEPGYNPIPLTWCHGDDYDEMQNHARELNAEAGLSVDAEARIICSTMRRRA